MVLLQCSLTKTKLRTMVLLQYSLSCAQWLSWAESAPLDQIVRTLSLDIFVSSADTLNSLRIFQTPSVILNYPSFCHLQMKYILEVKTLPGKLELLEVKTLPGKLELSPNSLCQYLKYFSQIFGYY